VIDNVDVQQLGPRQHILAVLQRHREGGFRLNMPFYLMLVAEVCFTVGDRAHADRMLEEALDLARATGEAWVRPELLRRRARAGEASPPEHGQGRDRRQLQGTSALRATRG
jgi:hypothetical protein